MKKARIALLLPVLFLAFSLQSMVASKGVLGTWKYTSPNAPYEYNTGEIAISQADGEYKVVISIDGGSMEGTHVKVEGNTITFSVWVEGSSIPVELTANGDKMEGFSQTPEGDLKIKCTRKK
ncbi:hypothetical protein [Sediminicola luteus]|uniref:Lipocalin-like domain-containing protein n=1 Tax=Sediminicola luteus TaxID=319238 RepID=A0A2A4GE27_9FLAO|nr:hypothetical protein [Sediminicola luteus]PCE66012.1 hypothetical protein B7P33_01540 [Sediminicola luteus]